MTTLRKCECCGRVCRAGKWVFNDYFAGLAKHLTVCPFCRKLEKAFPNRETVAPSVHFVDGDGGDTLTVEVRDNLKP